MFRWTVHLKGPPTTHRSGSYSSYRYFPSFVAPVGQELYAFHTPPDGCNVKYVYSQGCRRWMCARMCVSVFNPVSLRWRELCPPATPTAEGPPDPGLRKPAVVPIDETVYVWGGEFFDFNLNHELFTFHVRTHRWLRPRVSGKAPIPSKDVSACAVPGSKVIYVVSGIDLFKLDTASMVWSWIDTTDSAMPLRSNCWHSATIVGTRMFVMEGDTLLPAEQVVRVFDLDTERWLGRSRKPSDRWIQHASFSYGGEVYVLCHKVYTAAGVRSRLGWPPPLEPYFGELLKLDMQDLSWKKVQLGGPSPGYSETWCSCLLGGRVVIFGRGNCEARPNLFVLDLSPSLKTLCKVAVIQWGLQQRSEFPHNVKWELAAMTQQEYGNIPSSQQEHENKPNTTARASTEQGRI